MSIFLVDFMEILWNLTCRVNQLIDFYMIGTSIIKQLNEMNESISITLKKIRNLVF